MSYIYIDESGDLGVSKKGSKYFIFSCVKIDKEKTNKRFKRIPKKIRQRKLKKKYKNCPELKFSNSSLLIREQFLTRVAKLDLEIYSLIIKKSSTNKPLRDNLPILYNYLIKILLEKVFKNINNNKKLYIFLDKCMSPNQRQNFENYIKTEFFYLFEKLPNVIIKHQNSINNECLQVIDFVCGAFGYKYNTMKLSGDANHYTNIVKNKTIVEKDDLFRK
ncbi:DUF3800 domain-containing protein [Candidatus Woesearchaeota archaeon]|nr:DUF3800 domain-containing protein [Candidatus Woesearchaeota archaeon]